MATASALAVLQEEELARCRSKNKGKEFAKGVFKPTQGKLKGGENDRIMPVLNKIEGEDKLASLRDFRRKDGLCFKCGGKWDKNHKCLAQIPIHVLEELLDALEDFEQDPSVEEESWRMM